MESYNSSSSGYYDYLFLELADPRTNDWLLIKSPFPGLAIIGAYLYFVISWGPKFMQNRKPYELKHVLIIYNILQVCISCFLVYEAIEGLWFKPRFSFKCHPVDFTVNTDALREARDVHIYFLAKITELLDTVFFVLRKKNNQITFLHLYHHTVMPMISWGTTKYFPGGHGTFVGVINSFVHIIMYTYYMLAACGPRFQPYLWWKRYITVLQMAQFLIVLIHQMQLLWVPCDYPTYSLCFTAPNAVFFIYLFNDFYGKSYKQRNEERLKKQQAADKVITDNNNINARSDDTENVTQNVKDEVRTTVSRRVHGGESGNRTQGEL